MARKRESISPHSGDKRYSRRDSAGRFEEMEDVGRSLTRDRKKRARRSAAHGEGDKGDREF